MLSTNPSSVPNEIKSMVIEAMDQHMFEPRRWNITYTHTNDPTDLKEYVRISFDRGAVDREPVTYYGQIPIEPEIADRKQYDMVERRVHETVRDIQTQFVEYHFDEIFLYGRYLKYLVTDRQGLFYCNNCHVKTTVDRHFTQNVRTTPSSGSSTHTEKENEMETVARGSAVLGVKGCWRHIDEFQRSQQFSYDSRKI